MYICIICGYSITPGTHICPHCHHFFQDNELQKMTRIDIHEYYKRKVALYTKFKKLPVVPQCITITRKGNHTLRKITLSNKVIILTRIRERR